MQVDALNSELLERLIEIENAAAHLSVMADIAAAYAYVERQKADTAQRLLSEIKTYVALLPDGAKLELRAAKPDDRDPARRLGVRCRPVPPRSSETAAPSSRPAPKPQGSPPAHYSGRGLPEPPPPAAAHQRPS